MVEGEEMGLFYPRTLIPQVLSPSYAALRLTFIILITSRFGNPSQLPSALKSTYIAFATHFCNAFAPEILNTYLEQVELYVSGQEWMSRKSQYLVFSFFTEW